MISVIIPLYNKEQSIAGTIEQVLKQTFSDFEIIVVNDGSTDKSAEIVRSFHDHRIRLFEKQNEGVSSARNFGIRKAKYQYISFLDADDYWVDNYLEKLYQLIISFPECGMWGIGYGHEYDENSRELIEQNYFRGIVDNYWKWHPLGAFWTSSTTIRKDVFDTAGYFDERIRWGEDIDMWYRVILNYTVAFDSEVLVYYRQHAENRAMKKIVQMNAFLPYYIDKYAKYRRQNKDFRIFFDHEILGRIYPYFVTNKKDDDVQRILKQINIFEQKKSYWLKFKWPLIYSFFKKIGL